ncbi:MAG: hypothetical protein CFE24_01075 [Flavobacterium sp. BFFFF2]|nr:MAG: hypothetical protein CFE24_01075 [Flavobacterium sp. BFFFF2]
MNATQNNRLLYQLIFIVCVGVPYINNYELTFAVWLIALLATVQLKYSVSFLKYVLPFVVILLVGGFSMFSFDNDIYGIIRDITYLLKPIIGMIVGYQLCKNVNHKAISTVIYGGLVIAIIHLTIIFLSAVKYRILNIHVLREYGGYFSDYEIYVLIILLFHKQFQLQFIKRTLWLYIFLLGFSSALYVSRTNFIQFFIFFIALKGYLSVNKKTIAVLGSIILTTVIGYSIIYNLHFSRNGSGLDAFFYKIKNAPIEAFKTKIDQDDYEDFNDNYRSFENIKTVKQVTAEGWFAIVFGKGLGSSVDVGRRMLTNDGTFVRHEAILHNTYMTVFLKSGLIGVLCLLYSMYVLTKNKKSPIPKVNQINLLLFATGVFLILENWVLLGLFLKTESKAVLIGFLICYKEFLIKQHQLETVTNE